MTELEILNGCLEARESRARAKLEAFQARLAADPAFAFDTCEDAMEAAAVLAVTRVARTVIDGAIADGESTKDALLHARERARNEAFRLARWPKRSSSAPSNAMHQNLAAAWADFAADTEWFI